MEGRQCLLAQYRALSLQNSTKDVILQTVCGFNYSTSLDRGKVHQATNTIQRQTEVRAGPQGTPHPGPRDDQGGPRIQTQNWGLPCSPHRAFLQYVPQSHAQRDVELHVSHQLCGRGKDTSDRLVGTPEKTNKQINKNHVSFLSRP